jgi:hypothetical protein
MGRSRPDEPFGQYVMPVKFSWNTHCIITQSALDSCKVPDLNSKISVTEIDHFIRTTREELPVLLEDFQHEVLQDTHGRSGGEFSRFRIETVDDLVLALRINPKTTFSYVRALRPDEVAANTDHDPSRKGPPASSYIGTGNMELITVREVFATFSDEPDWGMDQGLFPIKDYRYGAAPFGPETGPSSQAPFHMKFLHENVVLLRIWPWLKGSLMEPRIRLFLQLAKLALDKGVDYWGWRFAAWAAHYLQDLTQPYHARALPFSLWRTVRLFLASPYLDLERRKNYLANRHMLFEAGVHFVLNDAVKNGSAERLLKALAGSGESAQGPLSHLMRESSRIPAGRAVEVNRLLERIIDDERLNQFDYSFTEGADFPMALKFANAATERPRVLERFLELLALCLSEAGKVTRHVVNAVGAMRH